MIAFLLAAEAASWADAAILITSIAFYAFLMWLFFR